jgi:hypothetical protein
VKFEDRIKKEMTEGIVRAILEQAGYRVIDSGIEKFYRELSCLSANEYSNLAYPSALRKLPDFTVMDKNQTEKYLVEVKYRSDWNVSVFSDALDQVKLFGEIVLVSIYANAPDPNEYNSPARFIRCCRVRYLNDRHEIQVNEFSKKTSLTWKPLSELSDNPALWWAMPKLYEVFSLIEKDSKQIKTFEAAINAISGILTVAQPA